MINFYRVFFFEKIDSTSMKIFTIIISLFLILACNDSKPSTVETTPTKIAVVKNTTPALPEIKIDESITLDFLMGKFDPTKHPNFISIEKKYASRGGMLLQKESYEAFKEMYAAAKKEGINLTIKSATRNFFSQKNIWEAKWTGKRQTTGVKDIQKEFPNPKDRALKILEFSSMPSTSRHHWGTDIDLNNFTNKYFESGQGKKEYDWLLKHAANFGFCQPYTKKDSTRPHGYNEEKWHWSYLPLATKYSDQMKLRMKDEMVKGFYGAETAKEIGVVEKYILGINKSCL